jgi:DNA-binding transcriptional LysR family regulator
MKTPFGPLHVFTTIARHRNMRAAANALDLQPSTVSHQLKVLEDRIGTKLISRTTRSLELTEEGRALFERTLPALDELEHAFEFAANESQQEKGRVRISIPEFAWSFMFRDKVKSFRETYPDIELEFSLSDRLVDLYVESVDLGVRLGDRLDEDKIAIPISKPLTCGLIASAGYVDRYGKPDTPASLFEHQAIRYRFPGSGALFSWPLVGPDGEQQVDVAPDLIVDSVNAQLDLVRDGCGIGYVFLDYIQDEIERGEIVEILPDYQREYPALYLYYPVERRGSDLIRAVIAHFSDA